MAADMSHTERNLIPSGMSFSDGNVSESWKRFKQKLNFYFRGIPETRLTNHRKIGILMTALGDAGLDVYNTFTEIDESSSYEEVLAAFENYCTPRRNTVYERFRFSQLVQGSLNIDAFTVALKGQAKRCEFGDASDDLVRDRLVVGIRNSVVRKELLRDPDLTLDKAIEIARAWERSETEATAISTYVTSSLREGENVAVDRLENRSRSLVPSRSAYPQCPKCAYNHPPERCPAEGKECNYCREKNHFVSVCPKKSTQRRDPPPTVPVQSSSTQANGAAVAPVESVEPADLSLLHICRIAADLQKAWLVSVRIGSSKMRFKLDTGAECNVLAYDLFAKLDPRPVLGPSKVRLRAFNADDVIVPCGEIRVPCHINGRACVVSFIVVETNAALGSSSENLIGLPTIIECGLIQRTCAVETVLPDHPLLTEFEAVFRGLGRAPGVYELVVKEGAQPVVSKPRRFPFSLRAAICETLRKLEQQNIVCPVSEPTDWVSNLVVVKKPNGGLRLCLDPKDLNAVIKVPKFEIPRIDDILVHLNGCRYFSVLDLTNGFWHLELSPESSLLTTFNSPLGRFRFKRMCFGVSSAPEIFMSAMVRFFGDLPGVAPYFDDLIIAGTSREEHDQRLRQVLVRAVQLNIRFNREKMQICQTTVKFLGFELSASGIRPLAKHTRAISDMPPPKDRNGVLRVLGMVRYLSRFVPNLAQSTECLRGLTKKNTPFQWTECHQNEFDKLKNEIMAATNLKFYNPQQDLYIQTDSSKSGMGCCLYQTQAPIAYASRALTETEIRYAQIEKELLAVVYALEHFHDYTYGRKVTVVTDHRPLLALVKKPIASVTPRLQRLRLRLMRYSFQLEFKPGCQMLIADTLSRAYLEDAEADESYQLLDVHASQKVVASPESYERLSAATSEDADFQALKVYLRGGWPKSKSRYTPFLKKCRTIASRLSFNGPLCFYDDRLFVPQSCVPLILATLHAGHLNVNKTLLLAKQTVFWLGMTTAIKNFVSACSVCNQWRRNNPPESLQSFPIATRPWERLHMDILTESGRDYLVIYDSYSHWLELFPLKSKQVSEIILIFKSLFARFGVPSHTVSDNVPFNSSEFLTFAAEWGFEPFFTSPRYPQSNGLSEKAVAVAKSLLRKNSAELSAALLSYRVAPIPHLGYSPSQLLMSRVLNSKFVVPESALQPAVVDAALVRQRKLRQQTSQEWYFNRQAHDLPPLAPGDAVLYKKDLGDAEWHPATVQGPSANPRSFALVDGASGRTFLRNRRFINKPARFRD